MKLIVLTVFAALTLSAQTAVPCDSIRIAGVGRVTYTDDTGVSCMDIPATLTVSLGEFAKAGTTGQQRDFKTGALVNASGVKFTSASNAIFWGILNSLAPQWLQAQARSAVAAASAALAAAQAKPAAQ